MNAASSATAAADSANVASAAQTAAEAACEETKKVAVLPATTTSRGSVMPDGLTISVTADGVITVKDVAIGGDLGDLASARGQVGDARQLADLDFNMLTVPGFYRTTGNPKNGPIGISGASIGSLFVSGMQGNGNRLFQIMVSGNGIYWRTSISGGTTWEIWNQVLTGNNIGDGIRNTNGIISVPEMQGATSAQAGVSGLVPPPLAADAGKVLGSDGTWSFPKDVAIGGDLEDLASARGIFDTLTKGSVDCNTLTDQGVYAISLAETVNGPGFSAKLIVFNGKNSKFTNQMALAAGAGTSGAVRVAYRAKNSEDIWSPWSEGILSGRIGDGITVNNGIISAPEYEGATASTAGTSGLVPPAAAGQHESFLTGGGEYKPALSTGGGVMTGSIQINDLENAIADLKTMHVSYLNEDYDRNVLDKWAGTVVNTDDCYDGMDGWSYVERHLGYRLWIAGAALSHSFWADTVEVNAALKNSGFAPFYRQTKVCVSVTDEAGAVCYTDEWEEKLLKLSGGNEDDRELALTGTIPIRGWESGTYRVYINLSDADSGEQILLANEADATENGYCLGEVAVR